MTLKRIKRRTRRLIAQSWIHLRRFQRKVAERPYVVQTGCHSDGTTSSDLSGKVVLVTGSTRGIGRAVAAGFAQQGARVVIHGTSEPTVSKTVAEIEAKGGSAVGISVDLRSTDGPEKLLRKAVAAASGVDIVINNAGITGPLGAQPWTATAAAADETFTVNLIAPYRLAAAAIAWFKQCGRPGRIINVSTGATETIAPGMALYGITKSGLEASTRFLAGDLEGDAITVTTLRLGSVHTEMTKQAFSWDKAELLPPAETVVPDFIDIATAPHRLVHGRAISSWRRHVAPEAERIVAGPLATAPSFRYPILLRKGEPIDRENPSYDLFDRGESQFDPSPRVFDAVRSELETRPISRYPDEHSDRLKEGLASALDVPTDWLAIGPGSFELIDRLVRLLVDAGGNVISNHPGWFGFGMTCKKHGVQICKVPFVIGSATNRSHHNLDGVLAAISSHTRLIYLISPSNPEGIPLCEDEFLQFLAFIPPHLPVIVDEAYIEFADDPDRLDTTKIIGRTDRTVIGLRTFSKFFGLAAMRVGYAIARPPMADIIERAGVVFSVGSIAATAAIAALEDVGHRANLKDTITTERERIARAVVELGLDSVRSQAPFMLVESPCEPAACFEAFAAEGTFLAPRTFYKDAYILYPVGRPEQNAANLSILSKLVWI